MSTNGWAGPRGPPRGPSPGIAATPDPVGTRRGALFACTFRFDKLCEAGALEDDGNSIERGGGIAAHLRPGGSIPQPESTRGVPPEDCRCLIVPSGHSAAQLRALSSELKTVSRLSPCHSLNQSPVEGIRRPVVSVAACDSSGLGASSQPGNLKHRVLPREPPGTNKTHKAHFLNGHKVRPNHTLPAFPLCFA